MNKINKVFLACFLLVGCRNIGYAQSEYEAKISAWQGKSAATLYAVWGTPVQITPLDSESYIATYYQSENQPIDNVFEPYTSEMNYDAMAVPDYGLPPPPPLFYCKTSFIIRHNIVTGYNFNGDDCYDPPIAP